MPQTGARIIIKSKYLNSSKNYNGGTGNYAQYIGTREGAVKIAEDTKNNDASEAQRKLIDDLIAKKPVLKKSLEYYEFNRNQTVGNASTFIDSAIDEFGMELVSIEKYAQYMATRPGVVKVHDNGLFTDGDKEINMKSVQEELQNYKGNVYCPIISLRPEDSIGYGYDNPESWHKLIERHRDEIAKEYCIQPENFRWVGAYHHAVNKDNYVHNHIHMICWSTNPNEGWQSKQTPEKIKSILAKDIFSQKMDPVYLESLKQQTESRNEMRAAAKEKLTETVQKLYETKSSNNDLISNELLLLADKMKDYEGRFYYKYVPKNIKLIVNNITDDLFKVNPDLQKALEAWADAKDTHMQIYKTNHYELPPPSEIGELTKPIKNQILNEVENIIQQNQQYNIDKTCIPILQKHLPAKFFNSENKISQTELKKKLDEVIPKQIPDSKNQLTSDFEILLDYRNHLPQEVDGSWKEANRQTYKERNASRRQLINALAKQYGVYVPKNKNGKKKNYKTVKSNGVNKELAQIAGKVNSENHMTVSQKNRDMIDKTAAETMNKASIKLPNFPKVKKGGPVKKDFVGMDQEELRRKLALEGRLSM